jgi:hypothetical protein
MALSEAQLEAISRYVGGGYVEINADCRGDSQGDEQVFSDIYHLDAALETAFTGEDQLLYRGVDRTYAEELERQGLEAGDTLVERAFLSTSRSKTVARRFLGYEPGGLLFRIRVAKGMRALNLTPYAVGSDEEEYLLPRETRMKVLGYDGDDDVLDLEVVDHG